MANQTQKTIGLLGVLNDLVRIHDDRIAAYRQVLSQSEKVDLGLRNEINKIISDGEYCKQQLLQKIKPLTGNDANGSQNHSKIYDAWRDLKTALPGIAQKSLIDCSLYNETIALYAFEAALDKNVEMDEETRQLIEKQEAELKEIKDEIKKYKRHTAFNYNRSLQFT